MALPQTTQNFVTSSIVAKETMAILRNTPSLMTFANRRFQSEYGSNMSRGYAPGDTISIKMPPRYGTRDGEIAIPQATLESSIPLTIGMSGVDLVFSGFQRTLMFDDLQEYISAAANALVNKIDAAGLSLMMSTVSNAVYLDGLVYPEIQNEAFSLISKARTVLDGQAAPQSDRYMITSPDMNSALVQGFGGLFNPTAKVSNMFNTGQFVSGLGLQAAVDQNMYPMDSSPIQTATVDTVTIVNGLLQISLTANIGYNIPPNTIITFNSAGVGTGVMDVNPVSQSPLPRLKTWLISNTPGPDSKILLLTPNPIFTTVMESQPEGYFNNCSRPPAHGDIVTFVTQALGKIDVGYVAHKSALTFAMVPMKRTTKGVGGEMIGQHTETTKDGFSIQVTEYYTGANNASNFRMDVLTGWAMPYPQLACKLLAAYP